MKKPPNYLTEWFRDLFASDLLRLTLSALIILSVLPFDWLQTYTLVFFAIFSFELYGRFIVLREDWQRRDINRVEIIFFAFDIIATLSFLPFEFLLEDIRLLRLFRLSRMLLLIGYWGPTVRQIWFILLKHERRYQIFFVGATVLILSFLSAILMYHFQTHVIDFNEDGNIQNDNFWSMLWWSFRQIQDPGNLVKDVQSSLYFFCSVVLTLSGLFVFSFLVGIASSVVEELLHVGREDRIGFRNHSVICNIGPHCRVLLEELVTYYTKSLRSPRIVTLGSHDRRAHYMYDPPLQQVRYRQGQPLIAHDLKKVDVDRARRVILLGRREQTTSDSEMVSQILSVREVNPACSIYAEIIHPHNVQPALEAGGARTYPVLVDRLLSLFIAKIAAFPGMEEIYSELLTSRGSEIYTCLYDQDAMEGRLPPTGPLLPFAELLERGQRAHGVILLGHLLNAPGETPDFMQALNPGQSTDKVFKAPSVPRVQELRGFFALAENFQQLKEFVESLPDVAPLPQKLRDPNAIPAFGVCPRATKNSRILICGFHSDLSRFCEQLILISDALNIFIMVPKAHQIDEAISSLLSRSQASHFFTPDSRVHFEKMGQGVIHYTTTAPLEQQGVIQIFEGDWASDQRIIDHPHAGYHLKDLDTVFFTYSAGESDPDARTALGLMKLIHLKEKFPEEVNPQLRIICEVQNTEKADLFQRRFGAGVDKETGTCHPISIIAAESMRNALLAQTVFVPGIERIYRELLSDTGEEICKLMVTSPALEPGQELSFGDLLMALYHRHQVILLAIEIEDHHGLRTLVVNPHQRHENYTFLAEQLRMIYVIGEHDRLPKTHGPCRRCYARRKK